MGLEGDSGNWLILVSFQITFPTFLVMVLCILLPLSSGFVCTLCKHKQQFWVTCMTVMLLFMWSGYEIEQMDPGCYEPIYFRRTYSLQKSTQPSCTPEEGLRADQNEKLNV